MTQTTPPTPRVLIPIQTEGVYVIVNIVSAELVTSEIFSDKETADRKLKSYNNWLGSYEVISLSQHIDSLHSWFGKGILEMAVEPDPTYTKSEVIGIIEAVLERAAYEAETETVYNGQGDQFSTYEGVNRDMIRKTPYLDLLTKTK